MELRETEEEIRRSIDPRIKPSASSSTSNPSVELRAGLSPSEKAVDNAASDSPVINTPDTPPSTSNDSTSESTASKHD